MHVSVTCFHSIMTRSSSNIVACPAGWGLTLSWLNRALNKPAS